MKLNGFIMPVRMEIHRLIAEGDIIDEQWVSGNEIPPVETRFRNEAISGIQAGVCVSHEITFIGYWCNASRGSA